MGKLPLKNKVCNLIFWALMLTYSSAERLYSYQGRALSWDDARSYCQVCFKDLVTMTPENIRHISKLVSSDSWIGLRKNFYSTSNSTINATSNSTINATNNYTGNTTNNFTGDATSNSTINATSNSTINATSNSTINATSNSTTNATSNSTTNATSNSTTNATSNSTINATSNSTTNATSNSTINATSNSSIPWSRWANGEPLSFQNWYPGWPKFKSTFPKRDCCSCSCTCPATTTTPRWTTPRATAPRATTPREENTTDIGDFTAANTDQNVTDISGVTESFSDTIDVSTQSPPVFSTTPPTATSMLSLEAECVRSPMLMLDVPDIDKDYIEDSCVARLSFGAWIEKHCFELLPFICYEEHFIGQANVTNVTSSSANLKWQQGPGNISHYRVEVNGQAEPVEISTNLTCDLLNLTAGTFYSVQVFAVKCGRDLSAQEVTFYTTPSKVKHLKAKVTETSVSLSWDKPDGKADIYFINDTRVQNESVREAIEINGLIPGSLYTFTVRSGVRDRSRESEESRITEYTKPGKVSDLKVSDHNDTSLLLTWKPPPKGNVSSYSVTCDDCLPETEEVTQNEWRATGLPVGTEITFSVRALINGTLEGEEVTISDYTAPGPISNLSLTSSHDTINAAWSPTGGNYSSFTAKLQLDGVDVEPKHTLKEPRVSFKELKTAANYTVIVSTVVGHLSSRPVNKSIFTLPLPPTDLKVIVCGKNNIGVEWKAPANASLAMYAVNISSSFWSHRFSDTVKNGTSYTFKDLNSGTNYTITVQTLAGENMSHPKKVTHYTEAEIREIRLSMMCSSAVPLYCEETTSRENVFDQLEAHFSKELGNGVVWSLVKQETPKKN